MLNRFARCGAALVALSSLVLSGCYSYGGHQLPQHSASQFPNREQQHDFFLAAQIPQEEAEIARYFERDLREFEVLPMLVFVQNRSKSSDFELRSFSYRVPGIGTFDPLTPEEVANRAAYSQWQSIIWYVLGIVPGFVSSFSISGSKSDMLQDYREKHIGPRILESGETQTVRGVLFFAPPSGHSLRSQSPQKGILEVQVTRIPHGSEEAPSEEFPATFVFQ